MDEGSASVKNTPDEIEETVSIARGFLFDRADPTYHDKGIACDFAEALVQIADACVVGLPCKKHFDSVHGKEAEELRKGIEQILEEYGAAAPPDDTWHSYQAMRRALIRLLDEVDARDSLAFLEDASP
jgi:hypothetical protein